ncbi:MAG: isocitrate/isopropylmalate family dehydrogenase [Betaproteobacteria bacterium]
MNLLVLPGDDIGAEMTAAALDIVKRVDVMYSLGLRFDTEDVGMASCNDSTLADQVIEAALAADAVIPGPCGMTEYRDPARAAPQSYPWKRPQKQCPSRPGPCRIRALFWGRDVYVGAAYRPYPCDAGGDRAHRERLPPAVAGGAHHQPARGLARTRSR